MISKDELLAMGDAKLRQVTTYASISVALVLIIIKLIAYFRTDSVTMLSSLLDSTVDLIASCVTAYGVASALRPPDRDHRFGHGKAEPLAALAQAAFIVGSSCLLAYEALSRLYHGHEIQHEFFGYVVMGFAIVMTILLLILQHHVVHRTGSMAIEADHLHYWGDLMVNIGVVTAFIIHQIFGINWIDPIFAIGIATALSYSAYNIAQDALNVLMDKELPEAERQDIITIVKAHAKVMGVHDLRTRFDGERKFIELHIEMDPDISLRDAHEVDEEIMEELIKHYPNCDVLIHQDPAGHHEQRLDNKIAGNA